VHHACCPVLLSPDVLLLALIAANLHQLWLVSANWPIAVMAVVAGCCAPVLLQLGGTRLCGCFQATVEPVASLCAVAHHCANWRMIWPAHTQHHDSVGITICTSLLFALSCTACRPSTASVPSYNCCKLTTFPHRRCCK